jgi:hypothetical protein
VSGSEELAAQLRADLRGALAQHTWRARLDANLTLEELVTARELGAFRPSPAQLALIRAADGTSIEGQRAHAKAGDVVAIAAEDVRHLKKTGAIVAETHEE